MKFFTQDDAPIIRPLLKTKPTGPQVSMGVNTRIFDGYGGIACERVTKVSGRSSFQTMAGFGLIILSGTALCALLVHFKAPKKSNQNSLRNTLVKKESSLRNVGLPAETRDSTGFDLLNTRKP